MKRAAPAQNPLPDLSLCFPAERQTPTNCHSATTIEKSQATDVAIAKPKGLSVGAISSLTHQNAAQIATAPRNELIL
jgi:hypothetical protein